MTTLETQTIQALKKEIVELKAEVVKAKDYGDTLNAASIIHLKAKVALREEIAALKKEIEMSGHDIAYLEIMVEDLMLLVSRLRNDVMSDATQIPCREGWAERVYRLTVENEGRFSEHGDTARNMHPNDKLKNKRRS